MWQHSCHAAVTLCHLCINMTPFPSSFSLHLTLILFSCVDTISPFPSHPWKHKQRWSNTLHISHLFRKTHKEKEPKSDLMARIPVRFERVAAAFGAEAARFRLCGSSGSEHSPEGSADLSDLVKSFMEKDDLSDQCVDDKDEKGDGIQDEDEGSDPKKKEILETLFGGNEDSEDERNAKAKIRGEVEVAYELVGDKGSPEFKRRLMTQLREKGFDAGLCKSKWEKNGRFPSGDYEYIDVNFAGKRYIVEVCLAREFEIARPSSQYSSLLDVFPLIFVGKVEELKQILRLMCTAIKGSMKSMDLHVPPWRRKGYMQAKWLAAYRRTTNDVSTRKSIALYPEALSARKSIGFEPEPVKTFNCSADYASKSGFRIGRLTAALSSHGFGTPL